MSGLLQDRNVSGWLMSKKGAGATLGLVKRLLWLPDEGEDPNAISVTLKPGEEIEVEVKAQ